MATPKILPPPAEWAPHDAVWIGFPSHPELWEEDLDPAREEVLAFARAVHADGRGERVILVAADGEAADAARAMAGDMADVVVQPFGDIWLRDTGPIVTGDGSPNEDTAPYKAWLGGFIGDDFGVDTLTDELHQDVAIPANTTALRLTAKYAVGTEEVTSGAYDTAQLAITQTNGTPIQVIKSLSNLTTTSGWVAIDQTINNAATLSGQTVRVRITSSNDYDGATSFFFDSFQLIATVCQ